MQIEQIIVGLTGAADADAVGGAVTTIGRDVFGLRECGLSWQRSPGGVPWWVREPAVFDRLYRAMKDDYAPVGQAPSTDGLHKLVLPVIEPAGILGAVCIGHGEALPAPIIRHLSTLAAHVSVRLVQLGVRAANEHALGRLTRRQTDVALLAAQGRPNAAIATSLGLSENTVKKHLKDIFDELGVSNRTELAIRVGRSETQMLRLASGER